MHSKLKLVGSMANSKASDRASVVASDTDLAGAQTLTAQAARLKEEEEKKNAADEVQECGETCICGRAFHFCADGRGKECFDCGEVIVALSRVMYCCTCNLMICSNCYG